MNRAWRWGGLRRVVVSFPPPPADRSLFGAPCPSPLSSRAPPSWRCCCGEGWPSAKDVVLGLQPSRCLVFWPFPRWCLSWRFWMSSLRCSFPEGFCKLQPGQMKSANSWEMPCTCYQFLRVLAGIQNSLQMESFIPSHRYILQTSALPKLNEDRQLLYFLWFSKTAYSFISHAFELWFQMVGIFT